MDAFIYNNIVAACIKVAPNNPGRDSVILYPPVVYIYMVYVVPTDGQMEDV